MLLPASPPSLQELSSQLASEANRAAAAEAAASAAAAAQVAAQRELAAAQAAGKSVHTLQVGWLAFFRASRTWVRCDAAQRGCADARMGGGGGKGRHTSIVCADGMLKLPQGHRWCTAQSAW